MAERPITKFRPGLERLEEKRPLSAAASTAPFENLKDRAGTPRHVSSDQKGDAGAKAEAQNAISAKAIKPNHGFLVYRITQPNRFNNHIELPLSGHVLVQKRPPIPGQVYNILQVAVRNGTAQTFDANSDFRVQVSGQHYTLPILTGNQQWKPGEEFVFYIMTKKYYPLRSQVSSGFQFYLDGAKSVAIPGPSGIFLRVKYNPATINRVLDSIVAFGPGTEGGAGIKFGLPVTSIFEFVSAKTNKDDFGGLF